MIYYRAFNLIQDKQIGKGGTGTAEDPYTYYERTQIVYVEIDVDSEADLPTMPFRQINTGYEQGTITYAAGSKAHAIAESTDWQINSSGQWIQQTPAGLANVYTKSQTDALIAGVRSEVYVHDSIQVNLNDITWTRSGGGMYYSQTIQLPDIALLYSVCLSGFASLKETDVIQPACRRSAGWSGFTLYANTNTFNSGAWVTVSGIGTRASQ